MDTSGERAVKQVIVMRKDLNMRKGKMIAQGAHASIAFLCGYGEFIEMADQGSRGLYNNVPITAAAAQWIRSGFTKVCVSVDSEEELLQIAVEAQKAVLPVHIITDKGLTEFAGIPTRTCLAIGPHYSDLIDPITGHLKLL